MGRNFNVKRSERIINSPQRYNPGFGAAREWKNDAVASIVYMIQDTNLNINVDTTSHGASMALYLTFHC